MIAWLFETTSGLDPSGSFRCAAKAAGHKVLEVEEDPAEADLPAVGVLLARGSIEFMNRIHALRCCPDGWTDSAPVDVRAWIRRLRNLALNSSYGCTTPADLIAGAGDAGMAWLGDRAFVRPLADGKQFSGLVVPVRPRPTPADFDLGFYFDNPDLPIMAAHVQEFWDEHRFIVIDGRVVAGSQYRVVGGRHLPSDEEVDAGAEYFAQQALAVLGYPWTALPAFCLDVCRVSDTDDQLERYRVVELNPFASSTLYRCNPNAVVAALSRRYS